MLCSNVGVFCQRSWYLLPFVSVSVSMATILGGNSMDGVSNKVWI